MSEKGKGRTQPTGDPKKMNHGVKSADSVGNKYSWKSAPKPKLPSKPKESGNRRDG
tara:strand:- start:81 stop:248 length:168 start_codon:yes stop_codon:yes gene_type:complete